VNIMQGAVRAITRSAEATTAAAGAVGGAAVNGVIGGMQGTVSGIKNGMSSGSHSTPAAAITLAAVGATGLVEWPILLGVGGTALVLHQLNQRSAGESKPTLTAASDTPPSRRPASAATRGSARKKTKATKTTKTTKTTKAAKSPSRTSTGRSRRSATKR
jgi:hypothetical protein